MSASDVNAILAAAESFDGAAADDRALADLPRNDRGNALRLIARRGADLIWVEETGWFVWDGRVWRRDPEAAAAALLAYETAVGIEAEARALEAEAREELAELAAMLDRPRRRDDPDAVTVWRARLTAHFGWAVTSGNQARAVAMLEAARPDLTRQARELDADPDLFCVANGTIELRRQGLWFRAHDRADLVSRMAAVDYDPAARAPKFGEFLGRVLPETEVAEFMQTLAGYILTGETGEQVMAILTGKGANGKSTLLNCMGGAMGDYAMAAAVESFLYQDRGGGGDKASPDMARLPGARMVSVSEPEIGARLSESRVKAVTGGEPIIARRLHKDFFEFDPAFKLLLSCNSKPTIRGSDDGIWRRIVIVPFGVQIPEGERVKDMHKALLKAEGPGILNWMLEGWRRWRGDGLAAPKGVTDAGEEYRRDSDPIGEFARWAVVEGPGSVGATRLYALYSAWVRRDGIDPVSQTLFGRKLGDMGFHKERAGTIYYDRVGLSAAAEKFEADVEKSAAPPPPDEPPEGYPM